jgi:cytochrome c peroxidase
MAARVMLCRALPRRSIKQITRQRPYARFNSTQSTPPPSQTGSWTLPVVGVLALAGAAGYYYYNRSGTHPGAIPTNIPPVTAKKITDVARKQDDYQTVYNAVAEVLEEGADDYDDGSFGPIIARLAWHASGTYDKETGTGGSNGATMVSPPSCSSDLTAALCS